MAFEEVDGGQREFTLLTQSDRFGWMSKTTGLDLDEDDLIAIPTNQIDLPLRSPISSDQDFHAFFAEKLRGDAFASIAKLTIPKRTDHRLFQVAMLLQDLTPSHSERSLNFRPFGTESTRQASRLEKSLGATLAFIVVAV